MKRKEDDEVRIMLPNDEPRTPESEAMFKQIIQTMREVGRKAKEGNGDANRS